MKHYEDWAVGAELVRVDESDCAVGFDCRKIPDRADYLRTERCRFAEVHLYL